MHINNGNIKKIVQQYLKLADSEKDEFTFQGVRLGRIGTWDVSKVKNTSKLFFNTRFDEDISSWDVSGVKNMEEMFYLNENFNQPIGNWNVSNVQNMRGMFIIAVKFNQPLGDWNVSKVKNMEGMFFRAESFNQSLAKWKLTSDVNIKNMFVMSPLQNKPGLQPQILAPSPSLSQIQRQTQTQTQTQFLKNTDTQIINNTPKIPLESITIASDTENTFYDFMSGEDVNIFDYLKEDEHNIIFRLKNHYFGSNKDILKKLIDDPQNIRYSCKRFYKLGNVPPEVIVNKKPVYFSMKSTGVPLQFVLLGQILSVLESNNKFFHIEESNEKLLTNVSEKLLYYKKK